MAMRIYGNLLPLLVMINWGAVNSLPTGAPTSACTSLTPSHALRSQSVASPYTITVSSASYRANDPITVTVTASSTAFRGILLQMRRSDNDAVVGWWTVSDADNYKTISCTHLNGAVTHKNRNMKASSVTFVWTAPDTAEVSVYAT
ncbi:putative defense protein 3 [Diadema setosum]|uniref:putative defense protein 3 n=1 Tax=Diadema setosum TaxID=31175 RepID=UPI003B3B7B89